MGTQSIGFRQIKGDFFTKLEALLGGSWFDLISMKLRSDSPQEDYAWLGMSPALREWIGGRQSKGLRDEALTIINKEFESTLEIPVKDIERAKVDQIGIRISELAGRAAEHPAKLASTFIDNGTGDTSGLCFDGQYFFDDDHVSGGSGTQKNVLTSSEVGQLDISDADAPTAVEVVNAVIGVIAYMMGYKDDQGEPMNGNAKEFLVMTSHLLFPYFAAGLFNQIINTGSGAIDSTVKAMEKDGFRIRLVANPRLTWTTQFCVFRTDVQTKPLIYQVEKDFSMSMLGAGSDNEFENNTHKFGVTGRYNLGYGIWQYASRSTLS